MWGTNIVILKRAEMISVQQKNKQNRPCRFVKNQICKVFFHLKTIKKTCSYHIITNLSSYKHPALDLEIKSSKLLSLIDHQMIKKEFQNIPVIELSKR